MLIVQKTCQERPFTISAKDPFPYGWVIFWKKRFCYIHYSRSQIWQTQTNGTLVGYESSLKEKKFASGSKHSRK